jgi:glutathione S-transferase
MDPLVPVHGSLPEVEELTGQRWVPVLVHGDEVINDSRRILEYLNWLEKHKEVA